MIDANGVTMAAVQALYQQNQELLRTVEQLQTRLARVERSVKNSRTSQRG